MSGEDYWLLVLRWESVMECSTRYLEPVRWCSATPSPVWRGEMRTFGLAACSRALNYPDKLFWLNVLPSPYNVNWITSSLFFVVIINPPKIWSLTCYTNTLYYIFYMLNIVFTIGHEAFTYQKLDICNLVYTQSDIYIYTNHKPTQEVQTQRQPNNMIVTVSRRNNTELHASRWHTTQSCFKAIHPRRGPEIPGKL